MIAGVERQIKKKGVKKYVANRENNDVKRKNVKYY